MAHGNKPDEIRPYKRVENIELDAHIFLPDDSIRIKKHSAVAFFHPGGWTMGEPAWGYDICSRCASLGMVAVSFQYRLTTDGGCSPIDAISDARSAMRWIRQQVDLNIDAAKVIAFGISAGAHLAACAAIIQEYDDDGDDLTVRCVPNALILQSACLNTVIVDSFAQLLQGRDIPENCSPAHHVRPGLPPMCLIHGTADDLVPYESVKEFTGSMLEAGNQCELHPFHGTDHFFGNVSDSSKVFKIIDEFLITYGFVDAAG